MRDKITLKRLLGWVDGALFPRMVELAQEIFNGAKSLTVYEAVIRCYDADGCRWGLSRPDLAAYIIGCSANDKEHKIYWGGYTPKRTFDEYSRERDWTRACRRLDFQFLYEIGHKP